jgi:predicted acylesterase/phospholipase RssA
MSLAQPSALVLQGGGSLGAYELGAARRLYQDDGFAPVTIAGVSIGAITAALLARPAKGMTPLQALEAFWRQVTLADWFLPPSFRPYASFFGNPNFFVPRTDFLDVATWTNFYDIAPLRKTLEHLVDTDALADREVRPRLLVSAVDVAAGEIVYFRSDTIRLTLDHVVASCSLPPSFAMTRIADRHYWDGGLFDNTPLGAVLDTLDRPVTAAMTIYVLNLFPNEAPLPRSMSDVVERMLNLQYSNKTREDLRLLERFNDVAKLMEALESLPEDHPVRASEGYRAVARQTYLRVPHIVPITRPEQAATFDGSDFSVEAIRERAEEGFRCADKALASRSLSRDEWRNTPHYGKAD